MCSVTEKLAAIVEEKNMALVSVFVSLTEDQALHRVHGDDQSSLEKVQECGFTNHFISQVLTERQMLAIDLDVAREERDTADTPDKAIAYMLVATVLLMEAVRSFPQERLEETVPDSTNASATTFVEMIQMSIDKAAVYEGQVDDIKKRFDEV